MRKYHVKSFIWIVNHFSPQSSEVNISIQHCSTLLNSLACLTRLGTLLNDVKWFCRMLNDVEWCWTKCDRHQTFVQQSCIQECLMVLSSFDLGVRVTSTVQKIKHKWSNVWKKGRIDIMLLSQRRLKFSPLSTRWKSIKFSWAYT